jgi:hypothetical protein
LIILNKNILNNACGENLAGAEEAVITEGSDYIFVNDPNFDPLTLYDLEGNIVNVNSWQECIHYTKGNWSTLPPETFDYSILYAPLIITGIFSIIYYFFKKKGINKDTAFDSINKFKDKFSFISNNSKIMNFLILSILLIQNFYIFDYVKAKATGLKPFVDEYISMTSNTEFFKNLDFNAGSAWEGSYSIYLTSGPISAIGSVIGWNLTGNFDIARVSNFYWIYFLQLFFCLVLYKIYSLNNRFIFLSTGLFLLIIPWWTGPLYSLGEVAATLIFVNSIYLFNWNRNISIILFSFSIFFGKLLLIIPFGAFYLAYFALNRNLKKAVKDFSFFLIPLLVWLLLVSLNYESGTITDYLVNMYNLITNHQSSGVDTFSNFSFVNILSNLNQSEYSQWNRYDIFRLLYFPIIFVFLVLKNKVNIENTFGNIAIPLISSISMTYVWFWLLSETKWIRYSQHFTVIIIISLLLFLGFGIIKKRVDLFLTIISLGLMMDDRKELLMPLVILTFFMLVANSEDFRIKYSRIIIFLILSANFIYPYYENQNKPSLDFVIIECSETLLSDNCKDRYFNE